MPKFIEQFIDTGLEREPEWTPEREEANQRDRLVHTCAVIAHALAVPRRLGGDASPAELAADKKVLKRALSRYAMYLRQWGGTDADYEEYMTANEASHRQGAQFNAKDWWANQQVALRNYLRDVATQANYNSYIKQGNSFCNRLVNELNALGDVFYDPDAE